MNTFSKTALFSGAMLVSGSVVNAGAYDFCMDKAVRGYITAGSAANIAWSKTKSGAQTVWTPSFVKPVEARMTDDSRLGVKVIVDQPAQSRTVRRFAYRAGLITAVVAPIAFVVYKKYGKKIAAQFKAAKEYVASKFASEKFEEVD